MRGLDREEYKKGKTETYMNELVPLSLEQILYRDTCRLRDHSGNIVRGNAVVKKDTAFIRIGTVRTLLSLVRELSLEIWDGFEAQTGGTLVFALALGNLKIIFCFLEVLLEVLYTLKSLALYVFCRQRVNKIGCMCVDYLLAR
jgi:hypothetical protein